jgi:signal transduction histidine kinase
LEETHEIIYGEGFCGTALELNQIRVTESIENDNRFIRAGIKDSGFGSFVAIPFSSNIGLINLASYKIRTFSSNELDMFSFLGQQLGLSISNTLSLHECLENEQTAKKVSCLSQELIRIKDIDQIALIVVEECRVILKGSAAIIGLSCEEINKNYSAGIDKRTLTKKVIDRISDYVANNDDFFVIKKNQQLDPIIEDFFRNNNIHSLHCLNLGNQNGDLGILCIAKNDSKNSFIDVMTLKRIQRQLRSAIERYLYNKQLTTIAVLAEQNRISRELHDSMAQQILSMQKQVEYIQLQLPRARKQSALDTIKHELHYLNSMFDNVYTDLREAISGLRIFKSNTTISFAETLNECLTYFKTHYKVELATDIQENMQIPLVIQVQVMRIIQEALTNIRKHSKAQTVSIVVKDENGVLTATIADDGIGFDTDSTVNQCGLAIMQERAENVGGLLTLSSHTNAGTKIAVKIPHGSLKVIS